MEGEQGDSYTVTEHYLTRNEYPEGSTKAEKGAIRKRAKKFRMVDRLLYYIGEKGGVPRQVSI